MKAKIKYPAAGGEQYWKKGDDGKTFCYVTVTDGNGNDYRVKALEDSPQWVLPAGAEVEIEVKDAPADNKPGFAYFVGQAPPRRTFSGAAPRKTYTVAEVGKTAEVAARLAAHVYVSLRKALQEKGETDVTAEDVRTMTNTLIIELVKRLP